VSTYTYKPSYSGVRDQEDHHSISGQIVPETLPQKTPITKKGLPSKCEALSSNSSTTRKKK
jgi:hypothetical protein